MGKCKTKATEANLGRFSHILAYSDIGISRNYSGIFRTLCNPSIFRNPVCSEHFAYSEPEIYSNSGILRVLVYSELNISFSRFLLYEINMNYFNTCQIFTPKVYQI